jgi:hypothetical protein
MVWKESLVSVHLPTLQKVWRANEELQVTKENRARLAGMATLETGDCRVCR